MAIDTEKLRRFKATWKPPTGLGSWFATVNNSAIGARYMITSFAFFLIAGVMALFMRTQLAIPENTFLDPETYNELFTMHGSTMMFLFVIPFLEGLANFILPQMVGARDLAFPRVTAFGYWVYLFGGVIFFMSFLVDAVPDAGWFAYTPLSGPEFSGLGMDFWLLGLGAIELAGIATGVELIVSILKLRAPGMSLNRMPLFAWAILVTAFAIIFSFTVLLVTTLLLELERSLGLPFFDPNSGGNPLLWQHLFWIFGHPEVYIMFIPATGIVSMVVPTFARRPIAGYLLVVLAILVTGFVSFGLWVHHMFTTGLPLLAASFFTVASFMIAIATGTQFFAWLATLWGSRPRFSTPMLFVLGFVVIFLLGGVTGVMVASVPFDFQAHDSYFVVAHFHYVLIGGVVFPIFAALYYWMPLISGRMLSERLGAWNFWLTFIGFNVAFFPMHISGLLGMPRRVYTYQEGTGLAGYNLLSTVGAYILAVGFLLFVVNFLMSWRSPIRAPSDPWQAGTLEWLVKSPPPNYNFETQPIVHSRYPLWQQEQVDQGDESTLRVVNAMAAGPTNFRATLATSVLAATPQAVWHLAGPSLLPIALAAGVTLVAVGPLVKLYWLMVIGAVMALAALALWLWPNARDRREMLEDPTLREAELPLAAARSRSVGWWGTALFVVAASVVIATFIFSYFYIRLYSPVWPQGDTPLPDLFLPTVAFALLALSALPAAWALRGATRNRVGPFRSGLLLSSLLGAAFVGLQVYEHLSLGFAPQANAYAALFYSLSALSILAASFGVGLNLAVLARLSVGHPLAVTATAAESASLVWNFAVVAGVVIYAVLYLSPHLF